MAHPNQMYSQAMMSQPMSQLMSQQGQSVGPGQAHVRPSQGYQAQGYQNMMGVGRPLTPYQLGLLQVRLQPPTVVNYRRRPFADLLHLVMGVQRISPRCMWEWSLTACLPLLAQLTAPSRA